MSWPRCSFVAEEAGDPLAGSAPPADRWLLIEHPGPWGRIAFAESGLAAATVTALADWTTAAAGRVLLVRRPGRAPTPEVRRWFRVDSRPGHEAIRTGLFDGDEELAAALTAPGAPHAGPLHLVCAHGRHDTCCAVRGRPVAAALAEAGGEVWESSHLGGCRFAPAVVLLPHGFVLGGVPPGAAARIAKDYRAGELEPRWVRGRSCLPPAAQAAQHHARLDTGARGVDALRLVELAPAGDGSRWRVRLADPDCTVALRERRVDTGRPLTCAATSPGWMRVFDLEGITAG